MAEFDYDMIGAIGGQASAMRTIPDDGPVLMLGILACTVTIILIIYHFFIPHLETWITRAAGFITRYVILAFKWVRGDEI